MNLDRFKSTKTLTLPISKSITETKTDRSLPLLDCGSPSQNDGYRIYENINFDPFKFNQLQFQLQHKSLKTITNFESDYSNISSADIFHNLDAPVEVKPIEVDLDLNVEVEVKTDDKIGFGLQILEAGAEQIKTKSKSAQTVAKILSFQRQHQEERRKQRQRLGSMPMSSSIGIDGIGGIGGEAEVELGKVTPHTQTKAKTNITQILSADPSGDAHPLQMEDSQKVKIPSDLHRHEYEHGNGTNNRNSLSPIVPLPLFSPETEKQTRKTTESVTSGPESEPEEPLEQLEHKGIPIPNVNSKSNSNSEDNKSDPEDRIASPQSEDDRESGYLSTHTNLAEAIIEASEVSGNKTAEAAAMFKINSIEITERTTETETETGQIKDVVMAEREDEEKIFQNHVLSPKLVLPAYCPNNSNNSTVPSSLVLNPINNTITTSTSTSMNSSTIVASASASASSSIYSNSNLAFTFYNTQQNHSVQNPSQSQTQNQNQSYSQYENDLCSENEVPLQVPLRRNKIEQQKMLHLEAEKEQEHDTDNTEEIAQVIRSINGVTTIEIKPIHHVIDLSPQKAEEIKRNRMQYKKSSRLSQFMSSEFKLDAPMSANALNVNKLGYVVKRKFGDWVRRIHDEDNEKFKSQANLNEFQDEDAQGQNEFEDLRRLVKQGGDFCKDLSAVLQERSELEAQYSKGLAKLSSKLLKASKEATGSVAHAWQAVAVHIDTQAELHRLWSVSLQEEVARPLKTSTETQSKIRKSVEVLVDKTTRNLAEWRMAEAKAKRQCFSCSKEFEKLQESNPSSEVRSRLLSVPPSDPIKLESKKRKAEETVRRADIEYYTFCVRSERARLEWESSIRNGSTCLRTLEEEKLTLLKDLAYKYFHAMSDLMPKLMRSTEVLEEPIKTCNVEQDMQTIVVRRHAGSEQLLPDFYAEDTSNLMKKDRRSEALQKCLFLIKQDLDRERKGTVGVENLAKAIADAPKIDNSHHDISDKLYYMKSMLLYLEAARIKLDITLADVEGKQKPTSAIIQYMRHQRDKQGLPQTILKVPSWARDDCLTPNNDSPDWSNDDRNIQLNHVNQLNHVDHDTDFDEFSSEAGSSDNVYEEDKDSVPSIGKCRVLYDYEKNLFDELTIRAGDLINIHDKQEDGWWLGELKGIVGIFPATYVEEMESSE